MAGKASAQAPGGEGRIYKIGEVVEMTGLTHRTLRYYEEFGLLGKRHHHHGRARVYTAQEVEQLQQVQQWQQLPGFSLKQIKGIVEKRQAVELLLEEARQERSGPKHEEKLLKAREQLQAQLDIVEKHLEKLAAVRRRLRQKIVEIDKEFD